MLTFNQYLERVNAAIESLPYPAQPAHLYEPISYTMALGGKRIRPVLVLMACEAVGGDIEKAIMPAVGLEMYHNFTLLHDDVMDKADIRRGKPTVHVKWDDNTAILSGDAMLTMATQLIARADAAVMPQVMELFNRTAMEIYEGQQYDMDFESRGDVTVEEYIAMIRLKTSVLLGCACKMGALIGGADEATAQRFYEIGENLGLAFQLQDDMLDVWGDEATFGKAIGGDIMNNKKTFLLINACQRATDDNRIELALWLNTENASRAVKVPAVTAIYERLGLKELSEAEIAKYNDKAMAAVFETAVDEPAKKAFIDLISRLVKRDR
ncbi:MAG: polyprenyl synthetase family protein [bacterium]|nr:polyprenyl synthetase family protein [bacterium]